jgi:hypothetical protein
MSVVGYKVALPILFFMYIMSLPEFGLLSNVIYFPGQDCPYNNNYIFNIPCYIYGLVITALIFSFFLIIGLLYTFICSCNFIITEHHDTKSQSRYNSIQDEEP